MYLKIKFGLFHSWTLESQRIEPVLSAASARRDWRQSLWLSGCAGGLCPGPGWRVSVLAAAGGAPPHV